MVAQRYIAQQPVDDFGQGFSTLNYGATLAATTDTSLTVPGLAQRYKAVIKCETDSVVWVALNQDATVALAGSFAAVSSEMVPVNGVLCKQVQADDVLHFYTAGTGIDVSVVFYSNT